MGAALTFTLGSCRLHSSLIELSIPTYLPNVLAPPLGRTLNIRRLVRLGSLLSAWTVTAWL